MAITHLVQAGVYLRSVKVKRINGHHHLGMVECDSHQNCVQI
jgi:hypothetical protein